MKSLELFDEIAELKEIDYKNTLAIVSMIELLIEKKLITRTDITKKAQFLDGLTVDQLRILKTNEGNH